MISVRVATTAEASLVVEIRERCFASVRDVYRPISDRQANPLSLPRERLDAFASVNKIDAGVIGLYNTEKTLRVVGLGVLPTYRRQGIARQLLQFAEQIAKRRGQDTIELSTIAETGNREWFQQQGFSVIERRVADWCLGPCGETVHELEMRRGLSPGLA